VLWLMFDHRLHSCVPERPLGLEMLRSDPDPGLKPSNFIEASADFKSGQKHRSGFRWGSIHRTFECVHL